MTPPHFFLDPLLHNVFRNSSVFTSIPQPGFLSLCNMPGNQAFPPLVLLVSPAPSHFTVIFHPNSFLSLSLSIALSTMRSLTGSLLNNQWYGLALECYEARKKDIKVSVYVDLEHLSRDITKKKM